MSLKQKLIDICHKVYDKGFVSAYDGNISTYSESNTILVTRSGISKGDITGKDILEINSDGKIISGEGKITTEIKIHLFAYARRHNVNAVVHCHPAFATAFAAAGEGFEKHVFPEVALTLGKVPLCAYATPSTDDLPKSMEKYIDFSWAFLLQNHGAVTFGKDLDDAYFKMEKLEHSAKTLCIARILGGEKEIPFEKVKELFDLAKITYNIDQDKRNIF